MEILDSLTESQTHTSPRVHVTVLIILEILDTLIESQTHNNSPCVHVTVLIILEILDTLTENQLTTTVLVFMSLSSLYWKYWTLLQRINSQQQSLCSCHCHHYTGNTGHSYRESTHNNSPCVHVTVIILEILDTLTENQTHNNSPCVHVTVIIILDTLTESQTHNNSCWPTDVPIPSAEPHMIG